MREKDRGGMEWVRRVRGQVKGFNVKLKEW